MAVVPGGQSFVVPEGAITTNSDGTGFSWAPSFVNGTAFVLVGGDNRGNGTGGSGTYTIKPSTNTVHCSSTTSSSIASGTFVGTTYPTMTPSSTGNPTVPVTPSTRVRANIPAIVGGTVGSFVFVFLLVACFLLLFCRRHSRKIEEKRAQMEPIAFTVLNNNITPVGRTQSKYIATSTTGRSGTVDALSSLRDSGISVGEDTTRSSGKGGTRMGPDNIIRHEDAGPSRIEEEVTELPPAYNELRR